MDNGDHDYVTTMLGAGQPRARCTSCASRSPTRATTSWCRCAARPAARSPTRRCSTRSAGSRSPTTRPTGCWRPSASAAAASTRSGSAPSPRPATCCSSVTPASWSPTTSTPCRARARAWRAPPGGAEERGSCSARASGAAGRLAHEDVLVLDVETGVERGRASVPSLFQSVLFPCPGWNRDAYYCSFSTVARIAVTPRPRRRRRRRRHSPQPRAQAGRAPARVASSRCSRRPSCAASASTCQAPPRNSPSGPSCRCSRWPARCSRCRPCSSARSGQPQVRARARRAAARHLLGDPARYHLNKRHWNTVEVDGSLPDRLVLDLVEDSYDLVLAGLPKHIQASLGWPPG